MTLIATAFLLRMSSAKNISANGDASPLVNSLNIFVGSSCKGVHYGLCLSGTPLFTVLKITDETTDLDFE